MNGAPRKNIGGTDIFAVVYNFQGEQQWIGGIFEKVTAKLIVLKDTSVFFCICIIGLTQRHLML